MGTLQTHRTVPEGVGEVDVEVIARSIYENFNNRRIDESAQWVADNCEWFDVASATVFRGPRGYIEFDQAWIRAFPDAWIEVTNLITSGDMVATEFTARGTNEGPLTGPTGEAISATGKWVEMRCVEVQQFAGGQIVRARVYYDSLSLLRQLGVVE